MASNDINKSDLTRLHNIVQNTMIRYPKQLLVHVLRDFFSQDSYYHYDQDEYGFANIADQTNLPLDAGMSDHLTTRLFIGEQFKNRTKYYPSIIVKFNSAKEVTLSPSKEYGVVQYEPIIYTDSATGIKTQVHIPKAHVFAGAWEGSLSVEISAKGSDARDELTQLTAMALSTIYFEEMIDAGVLIKPLSIGSPSEVQERNDYIFKQSITCDFRSEWRREVPIYNLIERIVVSVSFENFDSPPDSPTTTVVSELDYTDTLRGIFPNSI